MKSYLELHAEYDAIASGALVLDRRDRVLLLQRASHDSMPNRWELPGGAVDAEDVTILHGVARELWEEAGLVVEVFDQQIGDGHSFYLRDQRRCFKLEFLVEVESTESVTLDPNEHQRFVWASEGECRVGKVGTGDAALGIEFTTRAQEETILEGFRLRKEVKANPL